MSSLFVLFEDRQVYAMSKQMISYMNIVVNFIKRGRRCGVFAFFILALSGCATKKGLKEPLFFIQMTDTQFGFFETDQKFSKETQNFEKAIAAANRLRPSFVIITGDLVNKMGDPAQIAEYKRIAAKLDPSIQLYSVPGNHDVDNKPTPEILSAYRKEFGADYYTFKKGDLFGIVLNSGLIADPSRALQESEKQFKWLQSAFKQAKKSGCKSIIVFQHHPFFLQSPDEKDQYFNIPTPIRKKYLQLFKENGVSHIFAGHLHKNSFGKDGELEMVTTGPVGRPLGKDPSGIRIVTVKDGKIKHTYYDLGEIPVKM
jgi:3',5'-cyclic AMP phosphodiesterase CpdA